MFTPALRHWTILILLTMFSAAVARGDGLHCRLRASIRGDAQFFWTWGRDAWAGQGTIECFRSMPWLSDTAPDVVRSLPIKIRYECWNPGDGASLESVAFLELDGFTTEQIPEVIGTFAAYGAGKFGRDYLVLAQRTKVKWHVKLQALNSTVEDFPNLLQFGQLIIERDGN
jgi:hypothetical protein